MPAAFVLQWLLEVAAVPAAFAAVHTGHVVDPLGAGLSFALEPHQLYPVAVQLRAATATAAPLERRVEAAHTAYLGPATELALTYRPGVHLGPHQRLEMVRDVWSIALSRARGLPAPERGSCCYLYVLPGTHECTGCPRLRRRTPSLATGATGAVPPVGHPAVGHPAVGQPPDVTPPG
ncbi:hypothetical protein GCM10027517_10790 [Phycicoccus ginsengisoli]